MSRVNPVCPHRTPNVRSLGRVIRQVSHAVQHMEAVGVCPDELVVRPLRLMRSRGWYTEGFELHAGRSGYREHSPNLASDEGDGFRLVITSRLTIEDR